MKTARPARGARTTPDLVGSAGARRLLVIAATLAFAALLTGGVKLIPFVDQHRCVQLTIASSKEKFGFMGALAQSYDSSNPQVNGRCVNVSVFERDSGYAESDLANLWTTNLSDPRPDVWSPASEAWIELLSNTNGAKLIPHSSPSLFQSPLVIGMPQAYTQKLGYPRAPLGWKDIFGFVEHPATWAQKGDPTWGPFLLGKTNPTISTSGLHALIASFYAAPGFQLTDPGITAATASQFVGGIENGVVHYGRTAKEFLDDLANGPTQPPYYVSAVAVEEEQLVVYNQTAQVKLVPVYPSDGTIIATHPFVLLNWTGSSDENPKQAVANAFYNYVTTRPNEIDRNGFRLKDGTVYPQLEGYLTARGLTAEQSGVLISKPIPPPLLLQKMVGQWETLRKPARVLIVVDTAVPATALSNALRDLQNAASAPTGFQMQDEVGVWTFPGAGSSPHKLLPLTPAKQPSATEPSKSMLDQTLAGIRATSQGAEVADDLPSTLTAALAALNFPGDKSPPIEAILLIDMKSDQTGPADDSLSEQFLQSAVRVFTVGPKGNDRLALIAKVGRGAAYTPETTPDALNDVVSNF